jgi:hypothetical protein
MEYVVIHQDQAIGVVRLDQRVDVLEDLTLQRIVGVLEEPQHQRKGVLRLDLHRIVNYHGIGEAQPRCVMESPIHEGYVQGLEVHVRISLLH